MYDLYFAKTLNKWVSLSRRLSVMYQVTRPIWIRSGAHFSKVAVTFNTSPKMGQFYHSPLTSVLMKHAKKVVSNSPQLMNVAIELVHSVFTLPNRQWCILRNSNNNRTVKSILLVKKLLGLDEMMSGLVNASFSLPKWQAARMIFFTP